LRPRRVPKRGPRRGAREPRPDPVGDDPCPLPLTGAGGFFVRSPGGDRRAGRAHRAGSTGPRSGPRRGRTGRDRRRGHPGRGPAGTGRTGPARGGRADRRGGRPAAGGRGAGDSTGGGGRGRMAVGNRRGERKSMHAIAAGLPPERPPPPHEKRHVGVLEFFPFCIRDADQLLVSRCQVALVVTQPRQRRAKPRLRHHLLSALRRALPPRTSGGDTASPIPGETWAPSPPGRLVYRLLVPG
jgi:hypothetical protein